MRILGLDVGTTAVRAVEVDSAFGRFHVQDYHERPVPPAGSPFESAARLVESLQKKPDRIVVAIPSHQTTFRNVRVPTKDRKAVRAAIAFELEDELPFDLDKSAHDFTVLSQDSASTLVHVNATLKKYLAEFLSGLGEHGIDPDIITTQTWAYRTLFREPPSQDPVMLAHFGKDRTTLYVHSNGMPALTHDIAWGGQDITNRIKSRYRISDAEAEKAKLESGFILSQAHRSQATPEQIEFSATISDALQPFLHEIRQTIYSARKITEKRISKLFLSGSTSMIPGLRPAIEEQLRVQVLPFRALSAANPGKVSYSEESDARFALAAGLALCSVGPDRAHLINFRKGEFSKAGQGSTFSASSLEGPLLAAGAMGLCLFVSLFVQSQIYKSRISDLDKQLERNIKAFFGGLSPSATRSYLSNPKKLDEDVQKELKQKREIAKLLESDPRSPLGFLKNLSAKIPAKTLVLDMIRYQVGSSPEKPFPARSSTAGDTAEITFLMSKPQDISELTKLLETVLTDVKTSPTQTVPSPDGAGDKLRVTFTGTPKEDAYGR